MQTREREEHGDARQRVRHREPGAVAQKCSAERRWGSDRQRDHERENAGDEDRVSRGVEPDAASLQDDRKAGG